MTSTTAKLHRSPPFRAEHMGSLLRPSDLLAVRACLRDDPSLTPEAAGLPAIESTAVKAIVDLQLSCGFHAISSGEYTRQRFWGLFWDELEGTVRLQDATAEMFRLYHPDVVSLIERDRKVMPGDSVIAGGKIGYPRGGTGSNLHELRLVQGCAERERWGDIKLTMITPAWFHMRYKQGHAYTKEAYANDAEYFKDVAKAYQQELQMLYDNGLRNVQFDDPGLAYFCSTKFRTGFAEDPSNIGTVDDLLDAYIDLYNDSISKIPADMHVGVHLCRGNFIGGRHFAEGAYDIIATQLFTRLNAHTFYLEYDTSRAGGFEPLRHLPSNKNVIIGVISTKIPQLEDVDEMVARVRQAAKFVAEGDREREQAEGGAGEGEGGDGGDKGVEEEGIKKALQRMGVSPQCGFSTHETGYPLSWEEQRKKLELVREIAERVWPGKP